MDCNKCHRPLQDCQGCNGGKKLKGALGSYTCSKCQTTGLVCPTHGGHWK